ncbi:MAG: patatin-like phospholipase family protein [Acidimicrobiales bacterium]
MVTQLRRGRKRPRTAVVLGGGGNLGAIQVGQLRALAERGIEPDVVVGCSVGALNGAAFAADPTMDGVRRLEDIWRALADQPDSLMPGSWIPSPLLLVRKGAALNSNDGLRSTVEQFLGGRNEFEELAVPFQCVATDVDAGAEAWFSTGGLVEPILASAALPAVYPMVTIDDRRYLDGGVLNNVPINRAIDLGARKIFVGHVGLHGRPTPAVRRPADAALIAYWIARNGRFSRDLVNLPRDVEAVVLPPGERPELRFDDFSRTEELMEQGYAHAVEYLDQLDADDQNEELGDRAERLRADARRVIDELRGKVVDRWGGHGSPPRAEGHPDEDDHPDEHDLEEPDGL